jgi:hypothetical protein
LIFAQFFWALFLHALLLDVSCRYPVDGAYAYVHSCNVSDGAKFGMMQRYSASGFYNCQWGPIQVGRH